MVGDADCVHCRSEDFDENARPKTIVRQVFDYHRQGLIDTERMLDVRVLTRVARLIQRSGRALLLGFTAVAVVDPYTQIGRLIRR